ncbi:MAG: flagellar basal body rod protein FlgB [Fimbriimonadales bacterium]
MSLSVRSGTYRTFWDTPTLRTAERAMGLATARQRVLAHNLANANTPNYRRQDIQISPPTEPNRAVELARQHFGTPMRATHPSHLLTPPQPSQTMLTNQSSAPMRTDGNTVDPEHEMAALAETELRYAMLVRIAGGQIRTLETAINGGQGGR